jgi:alkylation response protein AidB-like acyl-CoA dehydrogenase
MDFRFDDEQLALRDAIRSFCQDHAGLATVAGRETQAAAAATWNALAGIGVFGLLVDAADGGAGAGAVEAAIVFEELGAHLVTGPVLWSTIGAPLVPGVSTGAVRVAGFEAAARPDEPVVVDHAPESDVVLVLRNDRVERLAASELPPPTPGEPFDPLTPAAAYLDLPAGDVVGGPHEARRMRLAGTVLASAMLVGAARGALDVASGYALERRQFGVPIGSFQAVKHLLADMYVRTELARSATYAAAAIHDDERAGDVAKAASTAKLLAGEAGIANGRTAVQVLGGMGFTWEMLPHYFLKRAWVLEHAFGTGDRHAQALGDALGEEVMEAVGDAVRDAAGNR